MPPRHSLFHRHPNRSQLSIGTQDTGEKQPYSDPAQSPTSPSREENRDNISPRRSEEVKFYQVAQSSAIEENPDHYYQRDPRVAVNKAEPKRRRFFGLGGSSAKDSGAATPRLERRQEQPQPVQHAQQRWSIVEDGEEDDDKDQTEDGGAGLRASHFHYITGGQPTLDNDPLRSPAFPPALTHEEYLSRRSAQQGATPDPTSRQNFERLSSYQSPWDKTGRQAQQHSREESGQQQTPSSHHPSPSSATSTTSHPFARRAPHEPLHQYYQEHSSRPSSAKSLEASPIAQHSRALESYQNIQDHGQDFSVTHLQSPMGPSATQQSSSTRRSSETAQQNLQSAGQGREGGAYQPYSQQGPILSSNGPQQYSAQLAPQGQIYRGGAQPSPMVQQGNHEQGRSTPPPSRSRDDLSSLDNAQLLARHDELQDKYRRVKKYYFDKDAQVVQLQNTLAHQRLAQSRTSLDDNEYGNRFQRLDGAINNLAFNIRRDWRSIPPWLAPHVNRDAATQPTKEMTAVGRACISRWLVDELLERYFHPSLDPQLSAQLKIIEKNLRRFAAPTPSEEEKDALLARISNWRLSTLDGLQEALSSAQAAEYRASLTKSLVEKLTASLSTMLKEPPPPGLEGGISMIVELAVGIAANLPLESRDVFVDYVTPGTLVQEAWMKIETGLPPLTNPGDGPTEGEGTSGLSKQTEETGSIDSRDTGASSGTGGEEAGPGGAVAVKEAAMQQQQAVQGKKKGMFGGLMGGTANKKLSASGPSSSQQAQQGQGQVQQQQGPPKEDRVRFSTFMAVEVRGRSVLVKAPVYVRE